MFAKVGTAFLNVERDHREAEIDFKHNGYESFRHNHQTLNHYFWKEAVLSYLLNSNTEKRSLDVFVF